MGQFKLKFEIGEIEFEAEGTYEEVERERKIFIEQILPLVANINVSKVEESVEPKEEIKALEEKIIVPPAVVCEGGLENKTTKKSCKKKKSTKK